jgi:uncharacterized membrane protein
MSLAPLLDATPAIPLHAFAAMTAFLLGVVQLAAPKGTLPHRTLGWVWISLMVLVAVSSFWIHQIRLVGPWSPIHLLSIFTLVMLPLGAWMAHRHRVADHRRIMILTFSGALGYSRSSRGGSCTACCSAHSKQPCKSCRRERVLALHKRSLETASRGRVPRPPRRLALTP